jgi:hypothetical protein
MGFFFWLLHAVGMGSFDELGEAVFVCPDFFVLLQQRALFLLKDYQVWDLLLLVLIVEICTAEINPRELHVFRSAMSELKKAGETVIDLEFDDLELDFERKFDLLTYQLCL